MSLTPVFDATLADHPANIWEASSLFPVPENVRLTAKYLERMVEIEPDIQLIKHLGQWVAA